jgi:hypothetical protein
MFFFLVEEFDFLIDSKIYGVGCCFPVLLFISFGLEVDVRWLKLIFPAYFIVPYGSVCGFIYKQ